MNTKLITYRVHISIHTHTETNMDFEGYRLGYAMKLTDIPLSYRLLFPPAAFPLVSL